MATPLYALADLHLTNDSRERYGMAKFGGHWIGHPDNLIAAWTETVPERALVLVPGDITLETKTEPATRDLALVHSLPGAWKPLIKGNHDMGFGRSLVKWQKQCAPYASLLPILGNAHTVTTPDGPVVVAGAKGALAPGDEFYAARWDDDTHVFIPDADREAANAKLYARELVRLEASLAAAASLRVAAAAAAGYAAASDVPLLVQIHYPPFVNLVEPTAFSAMIESAGAALCVYGHIHWDVQHRAAFQGERNGCAYRLVAADYLAMRPRKVGELDSGRLRIVSEAAANQHR